MRKNDFCLYVIPLIRSVIDAGYVLDDKIYNDCDFYELIKASLEHNITSLVYQGIINNSIAIDEDLQKLFKQRVIFEYIKSENQLLCYKDITALLEENNIRYIPLKGICMKSLYPKKELRRMGDIDIYVEETDVEKVQILMEKLQYKPEGRTDYDYKFKSPNDILIEMHTSFVSEENEFYSYYQNPWRMCTKKENSSEYNLNYEEMYIYLILHYIKHYRGGGIGINHIVDLWIYKNTIPHLNEDYINSRIEQFGFKNFYDNTIRMIGCLFGEDQDDAVVSEMVEFVVNSGSYGTREAHQAAVVIKNERKNESKARFKTIYEKIILPREKMEYIYPVLKEKPYLMFFFRVKRLIRRVFFKKEKELNVFDIIKSNSSQKIDEYKNHLNKVGL